MKEIEEKSRPIISWLHGLDELWWGSDRTFVDLVSAFIYLEGIVQESDRKSGAWLLAGAKSP